MRPAGRRATILAILIAAGVALGFGLHDAFRHLGVAGALLLSGNIEAHESVLSFQVPGRIASLPVEEGKSVEKDSILALLDDRDYRQQMERDQAGLKVAEATLALALAGTRTQQLEAYRQVTLSTQAELRQSRFDFERASKLYKSGVVPKETFDRAGTQLDRAQAAYSEAQQNYNQALEGTRKEDIDIAKANVAHARESLDLSRTQLDHTILRSPVDGVVTVRQAELGEVVVPGTPVATVADLDHVWLRAYVDETVIGRVHYRQPAHIRIDTFPGKSYRGEVSFVSSEAEFTPKSVETHKERVTLVYRIKIDLENPNHELKPGMPADATLSLE